MELSLFEKIIKHYTLAFLIFLFASLLLVSPETPILQTVLAVLLVHGWVYFVHRASHLIPNAFFNTHMKYHHQFPPKTIPRHLELFYETFFDSGMNLLLFGVQKALGVNWIPVPVILLFTVTYMSIHIINYSIFGSTFHRRHHDTLDKNFAPDAMDHIMGTNYNEEFEDLNPCSLNAFGACFLLYPLKEYIIKL